MVMMTQNSTPYEPKDINYADKEFEDKVWDDERCQPQMVYHNKVSEDVLERFRLSFLGGVVNLL
jgi:hypothetical protein